VTFAPLALASAELYASYSLKAHLDEGGLTEEQARITRGWKRELAAAGMTQLARFARRAGRQSALGGAGLATPVVITAEAFSSRALRRLIEDEGASPQPVDAVPLELPDDVLSMHALAPWLSVASDLGAIEAEYRAAIADAERAGVTFEPVRRVVTSPTIGERGPGRNVIGDDLSRDVAKLFNDAWAITLRTLLRSASAEPSEPTVRTARRLLSSVVRPLGEGLTRLPAGGDHAPGVYAGAPFGDFAEFEESTPLSDRLWSMALDATRLAGQSGMPAEISEAAAALQELAWRSVPADDRAGRVAALREAQASLPAGIRAAANGPYLVANVGDLVTHLGEPIEAPPLVALCRCGASDAKPFCDGVHARIEFTDRKDPHRVPDHRDSYEGVQATIMDNRGTCAHSGFCTDRLPSVFRLGGEPFVTPSGGRLDDVIGVVRSCPSGALSYSVNDREAREQIDQDRPPQLEVSLDGPYRVTGTIPLTDTHGEDVPRNVGAFREHYSLCRCGHSQNKPFCSGMHWHVDFHDPPAPESPTLFQWAGGLPALLRMTRIFYGKYVPEDPLLSPLFADMSPDHPERVAAWLGEVFGGPKRYSGTYGGYPRMVSQHLGKQITEAHRARWVAALCRAADDAKLPADAEFRAAFVAYLEWGSRLAVENSTIGAHPPADMPVPRWWWVCDATPDARISAFARAQDEDEDEEPVAAPLPAEGDSVSFERHIKSLFRSRDRQSMRFAFDLWAYDDVAQHGAGILARLRDGTMPCDGAWPEEKVQTFQRWLDSGMSP
jgi:CDGSH-type Zn-finger protein